MDKLKLLLLSGIILFWIGALGGFFYEWKYWAFIAMIGWFLSIVLPIWKKLF